MLAAAVQQSVGVKMKKHEKKDKHHKKEKEHEKKKEHKKHDPKPMHKKMGMGKSKIEKTMHEFKHGALHSGSKKGPLVHNPRQAVAIALSQARKAGAKIKPAKP